MFLIDERTDWYINNRDVEGYILLRLSELKVDEIAFVTEFWRQHKKEIRLSLSFIRYGFKYNHVFNERLNRPLDHPTWRQYIVDCLKEPMEKDSLDIDRGLWAIKHPGVGLPHHLRFLGYSDSFKDEIKKSE